MNILYFHQHFSPPESSGNNRSFELATYWAKAGHRVTIVCGSGNFSEPLPWFSLFKNYSINDFTVVRLNIQYSHFYSFSKRVFSFFKYLIICILLTFKWRQADIVYASSTPLTVGIIALWLKKIFNKPYIFETVDLWPDVPIQMGIIKSLLLVKALFTLEHLIYKEASHIVCLSEGMKEAIIAKRIDVHKVSVAHNGTNCSFFKPFENKMMAKSQLNLQKDKFIILYAGTIGEANGLTFLVDLADEIEKITPNTVQFLILGDGNRKEDVKKYFQSKDLQNIIFLDSIPKSDVKPYFDAADAGFVCFASYPLLETNSANKFYDYLASGLPVFINYGGWQKQYLDEFKAGISHTTSLGLAKKINLLSNNKTLLSQIGKNGRLLAEKRFDRYIISQIILDIFTSIKSN